MNTRIRVLSVALASTLAALACDSNSSSRRGDATPYTPRSDVEFIDALTPHHEMAIHMAGEVRERSATPELVEMAEAMISAQGAEIDRMEAVRLELTGKARVKEDSAMDPHDEGDMAALKTLEGDALDRRFIEDMLAHHAGALQLAHRARPNLENSDMIALADSTLLDQAREIGELGEMLAPTTEQRD